MGWIANATLRWADGRQQKEIGDYIRHLRSMDGDEIGWVMAIASHQRQKLETSRGWPLLYPAACWRLEPNIAIKLTQVTLEIQRQNSPQLAAGLMVWVHTIRVLSPTSSPELRQLGREMWGELSRGFKHVSSAADQIAAMTGNRPCIDGADNVPDGLAPTHRG